MQRLLLTLLLQLVLAGTASAALREENVVYRDGETNLAGYLVYDDATAEKRPGILVVHEWWGLNDYARMRARMLAELGYAALAVDMYGDGRTAGHPDDAGKFAAALRSNLPLAEARFTAALDFLRRQPMVDDGKIAAIGYCFGGGIVLEMARSGIDLKGVASFHGSLGTSHPARPGMVKARLLVLNGDDDSFVTSEQVAAFRKEMAAAGVDCRFIGYPHARHSFTNRDADAMGKKFHLNIGYDAEADRRSWQELQTFLKEVFR